MKIDFTTIRDAAGFYLRLMLGFTLLSAVADRLGFWGPPGAAGVAWGDWESFVAYTHQLNSYAGNYLAGLLAIIVTVLEIVFGVTLILGYKTRWAGLGTGILTLLFALAMAFSMGIKAPLDYSVFVDSGAGLLLAGMPGNKWAIDKYLLINQTGY